MTHSTTKEMSEEPFGEERIDLDELELKELGESWKHARKLEYEKTAQFIKPEEVYELALKFDNPRDRALFAILYLTAARIEEVVRYQKIKWGKKKVLFVKQGQKPKKKWVQNYNDMKKMGFLEPGLQVKDLHIEVQKETGRKIAVFKLRNLKNKQKQEKVKLIPVTLDNNIHVKFWNLIVQYLQTFDKDEDWKELFPFKKGNAERIINQIGWNPHFIRKVRLTHLVKYHGFIEQELRIFAGWTDTRPSKHYVKLNWEALIKKL